MTHHGQTIKDLHNCTYGCDVGHNLDDLPILSEQPWDLVPQGGNHGQVKEPDDAATHKCPVMVSIIVHAVVEINKMRTTLADVLAASTSLAPIRFATLVDPAMDNGKGIWKVVEVKVTKILWAAR
jgi:hypothetical protein